MVAPVRDRFPVFDVVLLRGERGDALAREAEWERVFHHYQPRLLNYFQRKSEGIVPVEDLLQEVWLRTSLQVKSLASARALWTWMLTVGNNLLRDELRRSRPVFESLADNVDEPEGGISEFIGIQRSSDVASDSAEWEDVRSKLSSEEVEFLSLLYVDNLSHEEVARRCGLATAMASRQRLRRIRQRFEL